ncbi:uncharacterized protein LOC143025501 [Oratosquilla oratoria]|uniref:uncharacterized protein LOC143025501 n=1 Tax=Oratosquilla oratoria TaxID=337810 RepID=UPI003F76E4DC
MADNGYSMCDVNFGRYFKVITKVGEKLLKEIIVVMFYRVSVCSDIYPRNLKELFCNVYKMSSTNYNREFNKDERPKLEEDVETTNIDVTLCAKVLRNLKIPCPALQTKVKTLKDQRNIVCHTDVVMDTARLMESLQDIKDLFKDILIVFGDLINENFDEKIERFFEEVDAIQTGCIHDDFSSYMNGLHNFRNDLKGKTITKGRRELLDLYSKFNILNPCSWLKDSFFSYFTIDKIYTSLKTVSNTQMFVVEDLLEGRTYKRICNFSDIPNVICMVGLPGSGKTALCRYILQEWCRGSCVIKNLNSLDLLLYVEIRHICSNSMISFLRNQLLIETSQEFQEDDIVPILLETNIMIILDGMDESTLQSRKVIEEFFITFGRERILITTRLEYMADVRIFANDSSLSNIFVEVCGFTHDSQQAFIRKAFQAIEPNEEKCQEEIDNLSDYIKSTGKKLGTLLELPLNVMLLVILWNETSGGISSVTTSTRLYYELFNLCKAKLVTRLKKCGAVFQVEKSVTQFMTYLGEVALEMLQRDRLVLDKEYEKQLMEKCDFLSIDNIQTLSSFLSYESHGPFVVDHRFSFLHKSQMEYFASLYIVDTVFPSYRNKSRNKRASMAKYLRRIVCFTRREENEKFVTSLNAWTENGHKKYFNTCMYVVGQLVIQKRMTDRSAEIIVKYFKKNVKIDRVNISIWWQVLWEAEKDKCMGNALSGMHIPGDIMFSDSCFEGNGSPELQFMLSTKQCLHIIIELVSSVFPNDVSEVSADLKHIKKKYPGFVQLCRHLKKVEQEVSLYLRYHYYTWGDMLLNDCILSTLMPRDSLTYFMGHLGKNGVRLLWHTKIQNLFVRVSSQEVLKELVIALNKVSDLKVLELCLDFVLTDMDLPVITHACKMSVKMRNITDDMVPLVIKVLISLGKTYDHVDLVASKLTADGGDQLLGQLLANEINIGTAIIIRTRHCPVYDNIEVLETALNCRIDWLW